ncbi:4Fe-4S dicluster domain-containing protein [Desulfovibrio sp. TomC]|uniref:4Fe-4S dicluster domain-containing protein n=1 Tax=Desulfovibrio sp. TomC TaxID=1562888 RepID=UPI000574C2B8|nr:4Fe-4S dicluster domain-containing protein [Desulfovibrio sp. TomC]KHK01462.1 Fe-S-cluster-containing hydrogenase components 2 [Desulfovibrio sp. TomC]
MHAFVLADPDCCIGCRACEIACSLAHLPAGCDPGRAMEQGAGFAPRLTIVREGGLVVPVQCRQCEDAPCARVCPAGCITSDGRSVTIVEAACTGCKACLAVCPVGTMNMLPATVGPARLVAGKCDLCRGRPSDSPNPVGPACLAVCPAGALTLYEPAALARLAADRRRLAALVLPQPQG